MIHPDAQCQRDDALTHKGSAVGGQDKQAAAHPTTQDNGAGEGAIDGGQGAAAEHSARPQGAITPRHSASPSEGSNCDPSSTPQHSASPSFDDPSHSNKNNFSPSHDKNSAHKNEHWRGGVARWGRRCCRAGRCRVSSNVDNEGGSGKTGTLYG